MFVSVEDFFPLVMMVVVILWTTVLEAFHKAQLLSTFVKFSASRIFDCFSGSFTLNEPCLFIVKSVPLEAFH